MARGPVVRTASVGRWLFAATVVASVMAMGGLLPLTLVAVSISSAVACALLWLEPPHRISRAARWLLLGWAILTLTTFLQAVPLPSGLVRAIAPVNAEIWGRALTPFGDAPPAWHPISVAPAATQLEVLRGLFYGTLLLSGVRIAAEERGTTFLEHVVITSATALAFVSLAHAATDAKRVFAVYTPRDIYAFAPGRYGPILNVNQLAAYLNAGACVALGVVLSRRPSAPRVLGLSAAVLLAGTSVWAASRGGTASLALGIVMTVGLTLYARRRFATTRADVAIPLGIVVASAAMIGLGLSEGAREDLASRDVSKVGVAVNALQLVGQSPWVGFGRGSFEGVFPLVRHSPLYVTFTNPENIVAQWTTEWGLPVTIVAATAIFRALRPSVVLTAARPPVAAWVAIVVLVLHDLVDFHLEVPGIMAVVVVCAAIVVGARGSSSSAPTATDGAPAKVRRLTFAVVLGVLPFALLAGGLRHHLLSDDRIRLSAAAIDPNVPVETFRAELHAAMERYPAEAFLPLMGAVRAQSAGEGNVMPWITRSLEINPRFGRAHYVLARSLAGRYRAQARLEYRLAYENDLNLRDAVLKEAPRLVDDADDAFELVPPGADGVPVLEQLAASLQLRLPSSVVRLDAELDSRDHDSPGVLRRRATAALSDVVNGHAWCAPREACERTAIAAAKAVVARSPKTCESHLQLAHARVVTGEAVQAFDELERGVDVVSDRGECERGLVQLALDTNQARRADVALERVLRSGCGTAVECAELYEWAAGIEESRRRSASAIALYKRAAAVNPQRWQLMQRIGELSMANGLFADAIDAYASLAQRFPDDLRWPAALSRAREELDRRRFDRKP